MSNTWSFALGDVNKDGKPNFALANTEARTITVLLHD